MTDWSGALARAFQKHIEFSGSSGSSGSSSQKSNILSGLSRDQLGTTADERVVPVVPTSRGPRGRNHWNHSQNEVVLDARDQNSKVDQDLSRAGTTRTTGTTENETSCANENFEERAALVEYGADVPRDWAEGFARLAIATPPTGLLHETWWAIVDDAARFLDDWGWKAAAVGWSALDVFGVSMPPPRIRCEMAGLLPAIAGGTVVAISSCSATIRSPSGQEVIWLRRPQPNAIAVWELAGPNDTPIHSEATSRLVDQQSSSKWASDDDGG
jgi:hypothetical protein